MTEFDKLARMVQRQSNVSEPIPPFYIRTLVDLDASIAKTLAKEKDAKKKMNALNAKALNAMKSKVKKSTKEFEKEVKQYTEVCVTFHYMPSFGRTPRLSNASSRPQTSLLKLPNPSPKRQKVLLTTTLIKGSLRSPRAAKPCNTLPRASSKICNLCRRPVVRR